jgi:hypothetical protein
MGLSFKEIAFFEANWRFNEAVHRTSTVLKRDLRRNFMEKIFIFGAFGWCVIHDECKYAYGIRFADNQW